MKERRGLRITTWNVNGIRNPFGYQPWRQERTFAAMFEILEADIVVMQETKIQRKDLRDDMVLVPGWDVFFSLPKHKKGYSGVAIYTRNSVCAPIRAEEGITGILTPPNSTTSFCDLPEDQQIGGYPTPRQLADCPLDAATLDSEGRCVILEFPAFVLIGVYCPANRDETRDEFRISFLDALDARVRNLVALGKRVFLTGDLNIIREGLDTAKAEEQLKKQGVTMEDYLSTPARRMFNQLLSDGTVIGERDEGREKPVLWDICRSFHPQREGMFTCWEQKINARPGNFGSRIDYVLCSEDWKDWFCDSNIQEGLMGSDHCPVYAMIKERVPINGQEVDVRDVMSADMFRGGQRNREWSTKDLIPLSAKLIPEFDRRRSIRDMFTKRPALISQESSVSNAGESEKSVPVLQPAPAFSSQISQDAQDANDIRDIKSTLFPSPSRPMKRPIEATSKPAKRGKSSSSPKTTSAATRGQPGKGQSSLMGFFKPKASQTNKENDEKLEADGGDENGSIPSPSRSPSIVRSPSKGGSLASAELPVTASLEPFDLASQKDVIDPVVSKESWSRLLGKRVVPRCDHDEPCISMKTKKPGENCGRYFYMCPRPIGPSGQKEKNTQWRCGTFIWSSDWTKDGT